MEERLQAIGIRPVYGGAHTNHATEMALVSFPDGSYLELMAIQTHADASAVDRHAWAKELRGNAGPTAWAVRAQDIAAETARLKTAGISVGPAERGGRERPDGIRLEWETADVGSGTRGSFFPFLIHDFTPRAQRAFPQGKPVTRDFDGIRMVVIAVRNLDAAVKLYRQAFGLPEPLRQADAAFGAHLAWFGGAPVILAQPLPADSWISARLEQFGEGPCAVVLSGAHGSGRQETIKSRWFGIEISWRNAGELGWRLGTSAM
jgi:catechol 2,3-dioxygenase-like lactoylglutathione lyase family enzyme